MTNRSLSSEPSDAPQIGERNLLAAMIFRAWWDIYSPHTIYRPPASRWVRSTTKTPFSFEWCCLLLGMEPADIRNVIMNNAAEATRHKSPSRRRAIRRKRAFAALKARLQLAA